MKRDPRVIMPVWTAFNNSSTSRQARENSLRSSSIGIALVLFFLFPVIVGAQALPPLPGWSHSSSLVIGTTAGWAPLPEGALVVNFPLLVRLDSAYFDFNQASGDGKDIRFFKGNGQPLFHEIEQWDASAGKAAVWVKIDTIKGNTVQSINMQWGNPAAPGISAGTNVFDTATGFSGVWHLGETTDTIARDQTAHGLFGTKKSAAEPAPVSGMIGIGQRFDGEDDYIDLGLSTGRNFVNGVRSATVSAWVKIQSFATNNQGVLQLSTWSGGEINSYSRANLEISGGSNKFIVYGRAPDDAGPNTVSSADLPILGAWYHFAGVIDFAADSMRLYLDGEPEAAVHAPFDSVTTDTTPTRSAAIGAGDNATYDYLDGIIDEVRVSKTARSANWIRLCYLNQRPGPGLVSFPVPAGCQSRFGVSDSVLRITEGQSASVSGIAKCAMLARWSALAGGVPTPLPMAGINLELGDVRVNGDTTLHFRFGGLYASGAPSGAAWQSKDISVHVTEAIAGPIAKPKAGKKPDLFFSIPGRGTLLSLENLGFRTAEILDVRGGLVKTLPIAPMVVWDGRNRTGRQAAPGVYLVRFRGEGTARQFKVFLP